MVIDIGKGILAAAVIPRARDSRRRHRSRDRPLARAVRRRVRRDRGPRVPGVVRVPRRQGRSDGRGPHLSISRRRSRCRCSARGCSSCCSTGFVGLATISAALAAVVFIGFTRLPEQSGLFVFACATAALLDLRAPRQHPPHAERHRVAVRAPGGALAARRQVTRVTAERIAARVGRRSTRTPARSSRARSASRAPPSGRASRSSPTGASRSSAVAGRRLPLGASASICSTRRLVRAALAPRTRGAHRAGSKCSRSSIRRIVICSSLPAPPRRASSTCASPSSSTRAAGGAGAAGARRSAAGSASRSVGSSRTRRPELAALTLAVGVVARRALAARGRRRRRAQVAERPRPRRAQARRHPARAQRPRRRAAATSWPASASTWRCRRSCSARSAIGRAARSISRRRSSGAPPRARRARGALDRRARGAVRRLSPTQGFAPYRADWRAADFLRGRARHARRRRGRRQRHGARHRGRRRAA